MQSKLLVLVLLLFSRAALASDKSDLETARAAYQRGEAAAQSGDWQAALTAFDVALAHSSRPLLKYDRGVMLERLGRTAEAGEAFAAYLAASPDAPERADLERFLKELRAPSPVAAPTPKLFALSTETVMASAPERRRVPRWAWGLVGGGIALAVGAVVVGITLGTLGTTHSGGSDLLPVTFR